MILIFATNNLHKLEEIKELASGKVVIKGLDESGFSGEIPEDFDSLEKNASQKAWYIYKRLGKDCFADDTGLEAEALDGDPGVYSARYARMGSPTYPDMPVNEGNIRKLLEMLEGKDNRKARFRTVISLIIKGEEQRFEGIVNGNILSKPSGSKGFGYDPVFQPEGYNISFAEMDLARKNLISHRARAMQEMISFLSPRKP